MKKIFEKHETLFCMLLIVAYVVISSYCNQKFGLTDYRSAIIHTVLSVVLLALVISLKRVAFYGLTKVADLKKYLYFIPLLLLLSVQLVNGVNINNTASEILFYIISMMNVGFLEEMIFRGFLFKMMAKDNLKSAIIVGSITFGMGHIVNLLNGQDLILTLMQICYATAIGYLFVTIFYKSKSLIPCIIVHGVFNSLPILSVGGISLYIETVFIVVVSVGYAVYINKTIKE